MTDLYCFPHSGGLSYQFRELAAALAPLNVRPVDYPGVAGEATAPASVRGFVESWLRTHEETDFGAAFLYGQSLGGLVAFEAALQLERRGSPAAGVVIAAAQSAVHSPPGDVDYERYSDDELLSWSFGTIQGRAPSEGDREVFGYFAPRLRRDLRMYGEYRPDGRLERTRVLLLLGTEDKVCPPEAKYYWADRISQLTWAEIKGRHLFHMDLPCATATAIRDWTMN